MSKCSIGDCKELAIVRGWCKDHYNYWYWHGGARLAKPQRRGVCSIEGCEREHDACGYCHKHYCTYMKYGDPLYERPKICTVDGCGARTECRGYCGRHYTRFRKYGDPLRVLTPPTRRRRKHGIVNTCLASGCHDPVRSRRYCDKHFAVLKEHSQKTPEYRSWIAMKRRCYNPNAQNYKFYGAKGIRVCERWRNSFIDFLNDMGLKPSTHHTLDRIKGDKNYGPDNCRWVTKSIQGINQKIPSTNQSGFRGVCLSKGGRWRAYIGKDGVQYYLGEYKNKLDAARVYNEAAIKLHGEYAQLNAIKTDNERAA
jgi:hypothetical protein